jgi:hypothetical protein
MAMSIPKATIAVIYEAKLIFVSQYTLFLDYYGRSSYACI